MGCDIHFFVEYRQMEYGQKMLVPKHPSVRKSPWAVHWIDNHYFEPAEPVDLWNSPKVIRRWYTDRNYEIFYRLAGVRGYEERFPALSLPRGLPEDVCIDLENQHEGEGYDAHSASFFTLSELSEADFGMVQYKKEFMETLQEMRLLALWECGEDYDNVRAVFWFDN